MEGSRIRLVPDRLQNDARSGALLLQRARDGGGRWETRYGVGTCTAPVHAPYMPWTNVPVRVKHTQHRYQLGDDGKWTK